MSRSRIQLPADRVNAPDFPSDFAWVNTDRSLSIKQDLKGCVVVLDFWTYCCINCMHVLPDLEFIENKYSGQPVIVIGVHSAKFDNESDESNIGQACQRYNIAHPVIVDQNHSIWSEYNVRAWPTLMVIDPQGKVVGALSGEGNRDVLDAVVEALLEEGRELGTLAVAAPVIERKSRVPAASGLAFPGKVLVSSAGDYLFVSDSNHNRVVISQPDGHVITIAGSGERGQIDGTFANAQFSNPQGLAFDGDHTLYVADTDNHTIRRLDLASRTVVTVAGTGEQVYDRRGGAKGIEQGLNSPWDVLLVDGKLYIAMAGPHQLWTLDLKSGTCEAWIGSGREDIDDGTGLFAALAQPSGLARKGDWLYFVDSEVSALRRVNLKTQSVETLIGSGLFDFGYKDGSFASALLQHPLGVAIHNEDILIADTYNHRLRAADVASRKIRTVAGDGTASAVANTDGTLSLYEPGGVSVHGDSAYIADTNHDRIVVLNLTTGIGSELQLRGLHAAGMRMEVTGDSLPIQHVPYSGHGALTVRLSAEFPKGYHLNREAPINYTFANSSQPTDAALEGAGKIGVLPVEFTLDSARINKDTTYDAMLSLAYCTDGNSGLCIPVTLAWRLQFSESAAATGVIELNSAVVPIAE